MHSLKELTAAGYSIENTKIASVALTMVDHGCLTLEIGLKGSGWGCMYGGYGLGKGYLGAKEFIGSAKGLEAIMRIMNTIGVSELFDAKGKYVRVATKSWGETIKIIGNVVDDQTITNAILIEHHSGFERPFYVFEKPGRKEKSND